MPKKCKHHDICGLNAEADSEGLCILHSANPDKDKKAFAKKVEEHREKRGDDFSYFVFPLRINFVRATFTERVIFKDATFTKEARFSGAKFSEGADFQRAKFTNGARFSGATFTSGTTPPNGADFSGATFSEWADFQGATFTERADFDGATFKSALFGWAKFIKEADFDRATFKTASFWQVKFTEWADFQEATFTKEADFGRATFTKWAKFRRTKFTMWADFGRATFTEVANFEDVTFMRGASFDRTSFKEEKEASFRNSHLLGRTLFLGEKADPKKKKNPIFSNVKVYFNNVDINPPDAVIFRDADLGRCSFLGTRIDKVEFTNVKWALLTGKLGSSRTGIYDEIILLDSIKSKKKSKKKDIKNLDWEHIERVCRDLKINHTASGDHERAGDFHYGEKEMRRRNRDAPRAHRFFLNLYRIISGYGERYLRPLFWAAVLVLLCTFGYLLLGISENEIPLNMANPFDWIKTTLYSFQVMAFFRPTYLEHTSLASTGLKVFQSIFGPIVIGLFALALRQRLKR